MAWKFLKIYNVQLVHGYITFTRLCSRFIGLITKNTFAFIKVRY